MSMQKIRRWGNYFPRIRGRECLNLSHWGKNPSKLSATLYLSFSPTIYFCQNLVEVVIAWNGKSMGKIRIGKSTHFWKTCFDLMGKKTPKNVCPFPHAFMFSSFLTFLESCWTFLIIHPSFVWSSHATELPVCFILCVFSCFPHCACPRNPFWCYGVNGQQRIMILWFIVVDLAHAMRRIVVEFELLILGFFSPFYWIVFGCKTFFLHPEFCILLGVHIFPWYELVWSGIGSELAW